MTYVNGPVSPFDALEIARDLVKRDECEHLFKEIRKEQEDVEAGPVYDPGDQNNDAYQRGVVRGLEIAMNVLDERVTWLRERWG